MGFAQRLGRHVRLALRAARVAFPVALVGGFLLGFLLPVEGDWVAGAAAAAIAVVGVAVLAFPARGDADPIVADVDAALERMGTADQVAHAFLRAALTLAGFALGLTLAARLLPSGLNP